MKLHNKATNEEIELTTYDYNNVALAFIIYCKYEKLDYDSFKCKGCRIDDTTKEFYWNSKAGLWIKQTARTENEEFTFDAIQN